MNAEETAGLVRLLRIRAAKDPVSADAADLIEDLTRENADLFAKADARLVLSAIADPEAEIMKLVEQIADLARRLDSVYPKLTPAMQAAVDRVTELEVIGPRLAEDLRREIAAVEPISPRREREGQSDQASTSRG
jgi:hypothetical protein